MVEERKFQVGQRVRALVDMGTPGEERYPLVGAEGNIDNAINLEDAEAYDVRFDGFTGLWEADVTELEAVAVEPQPADTRQPSRFYQPPQSRQVTCPSCRERVTPQRHFERLDNLLYRDGGTWATVCPNCGEEFPPSDPQPPASEGADKEAEMELNFNELTITQQRIIREVSKNINGRSPANGGFSSSSADRLADHGWLEKRYSGRRVFYRFTTAGRAAYERYLQEKAQVDLAMDAILAGQDSITPPANEGAVEALGEFIYDRLVDGIIPAVEALGENLYGTVLAGSSEQQDTLDALPKPTEGKCVICMGKGMIPNFAGGHDLCGHCNGSGNEPMVTQAGDEILDNMPLWMKEWASHHPFEDIPKELYEAHEEHARELDRLERENTQLRDEVERLRSSLEAAQEREKAYASALDKLVDSIPTQYTLENSELTHAFAIATLTLDEMTRNALRAASTGAASKEE